jgi:hypothetical protein
LGGRKIGTEKERRKKRKHLKHIHWRYLIMVVVLRMIVAPVAFMSVLESAELGKGPGLANRVEL